MISSGIRAWALAGIATEQAMRLDWTQGKLAAGLRHYDAGDFFAAHEEWECVWLTSLEPEKSFLQAVIQVAAAFHHLQRNNLQGTALLLQAALARIESYPASGGIAVAILSADIHEWLRALAADEPVSDLTPVRIKPC